MPGVGNPLAWNRYAYTLYNPLNYTDPSGHFTNEQLEEWFGEDWQHVIEQMFSQEFINILLDDEVALGDLLTFDINGKNYLGIFLLDEKGNLSLWDMDKGEKITLTGGIDPKAVYKNNGENSFTMMINNTDDLLPEKIYFQSDWRAGEELFVMNRIRIKWNCSGFGYVGIGLATVDLIRSFVEAATVPYIGITGLIVGLVDGVEFETYVQARPYTLCAFDDFSKIKYKSPVEWNFPLFETEE